MEGRKHPPISFWMAFPTEKLAFDENSLRERGFNFRPVAMLSSAILFLRGLGRGEIWTSAFTSTRQRHYENRIEIITVLRSLAHSLQDGDANWDTGWLTIASYLIIFYGVIRTTQNGPKFSCVATVWNIRKFPEKVTHNRQKKDRGQSKLSSEVP